MHYASERKGLQRCGAAKLAKKKKSLLGKGVISWLMALVQAQCHNQCTSCSSQLGLLYPQGEKSHPGRWAVVAWCLLRSALLINKQTNILPGKCGAIPHLWWEYPETVPGIVGDTTRLAVPRALRELSCNKPHLLWTTDTSCGKIFPKERGAHITLKSHSCCSNIPTPKCNSRIDTIQCHQLLMLKKTSTKQQTSKHNETSCQSQGCYLDTIFFFFKFAHYASSLTGTFRFRMFQLLSRSRESRKPAFRSFFS